MRRKEKLIISILILFLSIGFAAVATNLAINGNLLLGTNKDDFDVYFSSAIIDGEDLSTSVISNDGKSITYETKNLAIVGDSSELIYEVTNNSKQYDASVSINCNEYDTELINITNSIQKTIIPAKSKTTGEVNVYLKKTVLDEMEIKFTCNLEITAIERTELPEEGDVVETYSLGGYLLDENNNVVANEYVSVFSNTPNHVMTDENGYFYVEGLEVGTHEVYYMGKKTIEELKSMTKEEIKASAISSGTITTNSKNIEMSTGYKISEFKVGETDELKVVTLYNNEELLNRRILSEEEKSLELEIASEETWTNVYGNNGVEIEYDNSKINISNITESSNIIFSDSVSTSINEMDESNNYVLMLADEYIKETQECYLSADEYINGKELTNNTAICVDRKNIKINMNNNSINSSVNSTISAKGSNLEILGNGYIGNDKTIEDSSSIVNIGSNLKIDSKVADKCTENMNDTTSGLCIYGQYAINNWSSSSFTSGTYLDGGSYNGVIGIRNGEAIFNNIFSINDVSGNIAAWENDENNEIIINNSVIENYFTGSTIDISNTKKFYLNNNIISSTSGTGIKLTDAKLNMSGGITKTKSRALSLYKNSIANIDDINGKVYFSNENDFIMRINEESELNIDGKRANKDNKLFDADVCTDNSDDFNSGICIYSKYAGACTHFSDANISGATFITRYISLYHVRTGIVNLENSYFYNYGDTFEDPDNAVRDTVRNHYADSVMTIKNSTIINEHGTAFRASNANETLIENTELTTNYENIVVIENGANANLNNVNIEADGIPIVMSSTGNLTINGGTYKSIGDSITAMGVHRGTVIINDGYFYSNHNTIENYGVGTIYINDGEFISNTQHNIRGPIKNLSTNNIYINGGLFKSINGGAGIIAEGKAEYTGDIYMCNGTIEAKANDYHNNHLIAGSGNFYYSNKVKFSNGTNTPTANDNTFLNPNYSGTCTLN